MILGIMGMIDQIIDFNKSFVTQEVYEKHLYIFIFIALFLCSCGNHKADVATFSDVQMEDTLRTITKEMAYEGVNNYCHKEYDWSVAKDNPDIMYVQMGEETDSAYQVVFRSYTGAFVNFYVNKKSGTTRMEEYVPTLDIRNEAGAIDIFDYLEEKNEEDNKPMAQP